MSRIILPLLSDFIVWTYFLLRIIVIFNFAPWAVSSRKFRSYTISCSAFSQYYFFCVCVQISYSKSRRNISEYLSTKTCILSLHLNAQNVFSYRKIEKNPDSTHKRRMFTADKHTVTSLLVSSISTGYTNWTDVCRCLRFSSFITYVNFWWADCLHFQFYWFILKDHTKWNIQKPIPIRRNTQQWEWK